MTKTQAGGWDRRDFLGGAALLALALGLPIAAVKLSDLPADEAPTDRQRLLMREVSQLVIPRTATAGAGDVGAGDFVILALAHGLENRASCCRRVQQWTIFPTAAPMARSIRCAGWKRRWTSAPEETF